MTDKQEDASNVMTFDALYTTNQMQKLKVLLPYLEPSMQKHLAVYIKYRELRYTMDYVKRHTVTLCGCELSSHEKPDLKELCRQLRRYSTPEEIRQLEQIQNVLQTMETMQEMTQTMNAMREIFPDMNMDSIFGNPMSEAVQTGDYADNSEKPASPGSPMMDMLMNMMTPEQREMYEMFQQPPVNDP